MKSLEQQINQIERMLEKLPKGTFICTKQANHYKWEWYCDNKKHYIKKKNRKLAEKLAYKKFLVSMLNDLKNEKLSLDFYLRHRNPEKPEYQKLLEESPEIQRLISPFYKTLNTELEEWMNEPYEKSTLFSEYLNIDTSLGFKVRSKSEALICIHLYIHKIPFRYECALRLGKEIYYPDFTIRHPRTGKIIYWEHLGSIDKQKYVKRNYNKIAIYNEYGIYQTENLILTYETEQNPMTPQKIEKIIEDYFQ